MPPRPSLFLPEEGDFPPSATRPVGGLRVQPTRVYSSFGLLPVAAAPAPPAPAPSASILAPSGGGGGGGGVSGEAVQALEAAVAEQGRVVAKLKADKADKAAVDAQVAKLLELKNALPEGHPLRPVPKDKDAGAKKQQQPQQQQPQVDRKEVKEARMKDVLEEQQVAKMKALAELKGETFGLMPLLQSRPEDRKFRKWTLVGHMTPALVGTKVLLRGHCHAIRSGSGATFVLLRQRTDTVQVVVEGSTHAEMKAFVDQVPVESVVDVEGEVVSAEVKSTTMNKVEVKASSFFVVQAARHALPFQPREAERPPPEEGAEEAGAAGGKKTKTIMQETRLDHRTLDLRTPAMQAIARVSDSVIRLFAEYLRSLGFVEIMTPKLLGGSSEGGAEVFRTDYFGQVACLAQSPQLHKQMCAACSGFERVFEIGPVFRAEKSLTVRHMTEFHGLDVEMAIYEHYHEMLDVFSGLFFHIFDGLNRDNKRELEIVRNFWPFQDLVYRRPTGEDKALVLSFTDAIEMLAQDLASGAEGHISPEELANLRKLDKDSDPPTPVEKRLGVLVKAKYGVDFYMVDKYPLAVRPFYTMPDPINPNLSNSYDFFIRGQEILSGAQRLHDPVMLEKAIEAKGVPPKSLRFYIDSFKDGAMPHAGGGIGLERVVMLFLGIPNIRWAALFSRDPKRLWP